MSSVLSARSDKAALQGEKTKLIGLSQLRGDFTTFYTGAKHTSTPETRADAPTSFPSSKGFDHMESFYVGVESKPAENVHAEVTMNVLGNVAENPIDEIFYENRGRTNYINENGEYIDLGPLERVKVYSASFNWDGSLFNLNAFSVSPTTTGDMKETSLVCTRKQAMATTWTFTEVRPRWDARLKEKIVLRTEISFWTGIMVGSQSCITRQILPHIR